jgi:uncharacterized protein YkwD
MRHSFFTTRLASASLLFAMLAGALCAPAGIANAGGLGLHDIVPRGILPHGSKRNGAQEWLDKYYLPLPAPGGPYSVYPDATADAYADAVFAEVNAQRTQKGLPALRRNPHLDAVAQAHGAHMVQARFFEHESPLGMQAADRIAAAGGPDWTWVGENIAAGYQTPEIAVDQWMKSKGHRHNILNEQFEETGIGVLYDPRSYYGWYWIQVFATFDNHGQPVQWIATQGSAPAGAAAAHSSGGLTAAAVKGQTDEAGPDGTAAGDSTAAPGDNQPSGDPQAGPAPSSPPADPSDDSGNSATDGDEPAWTPAHPAK